MPQVAQKVCLAVPVLKRYVVSASAPLTSSNCSGATIRCRNPFLLQIEQLHSVTRQVGGDAEPHAPAMAAAGQCLWHVYSSEKCSIAGRVSHVLRGVSVGNALWAALGSGAAIRTPH
jgi:hypothetical protein